MKYSIVFCLLLLAQFAWSQGDLLLDYDIKITKKTVQFGDTLCYGPAIYEQHEGCLVLHKIINTEPDKYIWYSESSPSCGPMYGQKGTLEQLKDLGITIYGQLTSNDCMNHCAGCDCPSGITLHIKLLKSDYNRMAKEGTFPSPYGFGRILIPETPEVKD